MNPEEDIADKTTEENTDAPEDGGESATTCMICMEEWTIGSDHRLCCLKCGHLFGRSCIERWIKEKTSSAKCPTCNKPAKKADIRDLWCKTIKATDNTELTQLQDLLEKERKHRKTDSAVIFHQNLRLDILTKDISKLKKEVLEKRDRIIKLERYIQKVQRAGLPKAEPCGDDDMIILETCTDDDETSRNTVVEPVELKGKFHFSEKIESSAAGGCRSFALCPTASIIMVAQPAPANASAVFGSFGLRKYSIIDTNVREFIPLHSRTINSIQLKPAGDLILTSAQDKKVKITSITNNTCILSYQCQNDPVCVSWSAHRDQQFYVSSTNCFVTLYDMRNTSEYIYQTSRRIAATRVLSAVATSGADNLHGLLVNDAKGSQFLEVSPGSEYEMDTIDRSVEHLTTFQLPFEGLMGTADFDKHHDMALVTIRRSQLSQNSTHNLFKLEKSQNEDGSEKMECRSVRTFLGGQPGELLSHSRILKHPTEQEHVLVGACDSSARGVKLWDSSDNSVYQTIKTDQFVRDILVYNPENTNQHQLYTLSEKGLSIYRWDYA